MLCVLVDNDTDFGDWHVTIWNKDLSKQWRTIIDHEESPEFLNFIIGALVQEVFDMEYS